MTLQILNTTAIVAAAVAGLASMPGPVWAERVSVTLDGVYRYIGAAPSPTANFSLSFEVDRAPGACGGSGDFAVLLCGAGTVRYVNGPLDQMLALSEPPSALLFNAGSGGGFALYQQDLGLNRLGFRISGPQLWSGTLGNPTLVDGTYAVTLNPVYDPPVVYVSYAGQGFASGDPINNPFHDPVSLQSYNPLESGTIRIAAVPEPASAALLLLGLGAFAGLAARRSRRHDVLT